MLTGRQAGGFYEHVGLETLLYIENARKSQDQTKYCAKYNNLVEAIEKQKELIADLEESGAKLYRYARKAPQIHESYRIMHGRSNLHTRSLERYSRTHCGKRG